MRKADRAAAVRWGFSLAHVALIIPRLNVTLSPMVRQVDWVRGGERNTG